MCTAADLPGHSKGWMRLDITGTVTAFDPTQSTLTSWSRDEGVTGTIALKGLTASPERWIPGSTGGAWVIANQDLLHFDFRGTRVAQTRLPAPVADVTWNSRSMVITYRTQVPFLERRNLKDGKVEWTFGREGALSPQADHLAIFTPDDRLLLVSHGEPRCTVLDASGKAVQEITFTYKGGAGLACPLPSPLAWDTSRQGFARLAPGLAVPGMEGGIAVFRYDLATGTMTAHPFPLTTAHQLVGIVQEEAYFNPPSGGITILQVPPVP